MMEELVPGGVLGNHNGKWASDVSVLLFIGLKIASGFHINNLMIGSDSEGYFNMEENDLHPLGAMLNSCRSYATSYMESNGIAGSLAKLRHDAYDPGLLSLSILPLKSPRFFLDD